MFGTSSKNYHHPDDADQSQYDHNNRTIEDGGGGGGGETELLLSLQTSNSNEQILDPTTTTTTTTTTSSNSAAKKRPNQPKKNKSITETIGVFGPTTSTTPTSASSNNVKQRKQQQRLTKKSKQQPMTMETFIKYAALGLLVGQMVGLVLLMRYSRTVQRPPDTPLYLASTAVFAMEVMKLILCLLVVLYQTYETTNTNASSSVLLSYATELKHHTIDSPIEMFKLCIPSLLYTVQNNLLYLALTNLDAATYQVCYQLKILTTALFSALLLGRTFSKLKWISLVILTIGVAIVEVSGSGDQHMKGSASTDEADAIDKKNRFIGIVAVVCAACTSGFSGVYFEKILKGSTTSLWIRNIQMGIPSVLIAYITVYIKDSMDVTKYGFFGGYTVIVWIVIIVQAVGGLIVATVVKYADNVLKVFATSFSIIISCIISAFLFDFQPSFLFLIGTSFVVTATVMYSTPERKRNERKSLLPLHNTSSSSSNNINIHNSSDTNNNSTESK